MWQSVRAWVLTRKAYGDKGMILHCLTDEWGKQSYFIPSIRSVKSAIRPSMLFPMTPLHIVAKHTGKEQLERIKEASLIWHPDQMHQDPVRSAICIFIAELIDNMFGEQHSQVPLWEFLDKHLRLYNSSSDSDVHFALWMSIHLMKFSGSSFPSATKDNPYFDIRRAEWVPFETSSSMSSEESQLLSMLLECDWEDAGSLKSSETVRRHLMDGISSFWSWHLGEMRQLKSLDIVREYLGGM
jgi:DNA repair protein RecO (recombination protein O)